MEPRGRLLLFSKRPEAGRVKTRLTPPLDPKTALELYRAFLADQLGFAGDLRSQGLETEVRLDGPWRPSAELAPLLSGIPIRPQGPGDLGRRLERAFRDSFAARPIPALAIAVDAPTLPARIVLAALASLERGAAAVISPAADGGYVLIGCVRPLPSLFEAIPWGSGEVHAVTRRRARSASIRLDEIEGWYDVDDAGGLRRLRSELADERARRRAPRTWRLLGRAG